jgi:hypothetical protein
MPHRAWVIGLAVLTATAALTSGCGGNSTQSALQARLLAVADLPAGWSAVPASPGSITAGMRAPGYRRLITEGDGTERYPRSSHSAQAAGWAAPRCADDAARRLM